MMMKLGSYVGLDNRNLITKGKNSRLFTFSVNNNKQKSKQFVCLFILAIKNKNYKMCFLLVVPSTLMQFLGKYEGPKMY